MQRILVCGCGYVGTALGLRASALGHTVFGLRRDAGRVPPPIEAIAWDLAAGPPPLPGALDAVVFAVGPGSPDEAAYRGAYVTAFERLVEALRRAEARPACLVFVSSTGVYSQDGGVWVDETSPADAASPALRALLEGERLAAAAGAIVLRLGGIYGPGRAGLVERVRTGAARLPSTPLFSNRIHRDDCAGALLHLLALAAPERLYLGVDREPADQREVIAWLAARLGVAIPGAGDAADAHRPRGSKRCSSDRLTSSGYTFRYPTYREGYAPLVADALAAAGAGR